MESAKPPEHTFLVDLDGSVANYHKAMKAGLAALRAPEEEDVDWAAYGRAVPAHIEARMSLIKTQPGFWRQLEPIPDGMAVVDLIKSVGFEPTVLTKGPRKTTFGCEKSWFQGWSSMRTRPRGRHSSHRRM